MAKKTAQKKSSAGRHLKERQEKTVRGVSRFFYATNLMLEAAASLSKHELTRYETLLLSIFTNGIVSRKQVDREFRELLAVGAKDQTAAKLLAAAFTGLVDKGLIKPLQQGTAVQITKIGRSELKRLSRVVDTVYDRLIESMRGRERKEVQSLLQRIDRKA